MSQQLTISTQIKDPRIYNAFLDYCNLQNKTTDQVINELVASVTKPKERNSLTQFSGSISNESGDTIIDNVQKSRLENKKLSQKY